jgi:hypothetical protein
MNIYWKRWEQLLRGAAASTLISYWKRWDVEAAAPRPHLLLKGMRTIVTSFNTYISHVNVFTSNINEEGGTLRNFLLFLIFCDEKWSGEKTLHHHY